MNDTRTRHACAHERSHITDSLFYGHGYAAAESRRVFCDLCRYQRWLDIEAALALAQEELGMIPDGVGRQIAATARLENLDLDRVAHSIRASGHSLVGLLSELSRACPGESSQYVHFGPTTQDIQDTAQSLEMREILDELERWLRRCMRTLLGFIATHSQTIVLGRTHAQPAVPMTLGVKIAGWLDELLRQAERIAAMRPRILVVEIHGAVGTMAGFADGGPALCERIAQRLDLAVPRSSWHVARDRVTEFVCTLAMTSASLARIADEIRLLSRPEIGEFEISSPAGAIGSSTMPHKRNPEECEQIVALSRLAAGLTAPALLAMSGDGERDARALRIEWACVPDSAHYCLAACHLTSDVLDRLRVNDRRLQANLEAAGDMIFSEKLMLALAEPLGKQQAYELIYELASLARGEHRPLRETFEADPRCAGLLDAVQLDAAFEPANHLGAAAGLTAGVVEAANRYLHDPASGRPAPALGGAR